MHRVGEERLAASSLIPGGLVLSPALEGLGELSCAVSGERWQQKPRCRR